MKNEEEDIDARCVKTPGNDGVTRKTRGRAGTVGTKAFKVPNFGTVRVS